MQETKTKAKRRRKEGVEDIRVFADILLLQYCWCACNTIPKIRTGFGCVWFPNNPENPSERLWPQKTMSKMYIAIHSGGGDAFFYISYYFSLSFITNRWSLDNNYFQRVFQDHHIVYLFYLSHHRHHFLPFSVGQMLSGDQNRWLFGDFPNDL